MTSSSSARRGGTPAALTNLEARVDQKVRRAAAEVLPTPAAFGAALDLLAVQAGGDVVAVEKNLAFIGFDKTHDHIKSSRFAGPVRPYQRSDFTFFDSY